MVGGFALLKDVLKTQVYDLCHYRNRQSVVIPERILTKAPSAELRPDQHDQQSLPPYPLLDEIIRYYVEEDIAPQDIPVQYGIDETVVRQVVRMIDRNEYKRRQAPIGIKITDRAFGRDRRMPVTNRYGKQ